MFDNTAAACLLHLLQLLGDSFSVTQQPPLRDPCSPYSMLAYFKAFKQVVAMCNWDNCKRIEGMCTGISILGGENLVQCLELSKHCQTFLTCLFLYRGDCLNRRNIVIVFISQVRLQELLKYPSHTKTKNVKVTIRQLLPGPGNDYRYDLHYFPSTRE